MAEWLNITFANFDKTILTAIHEATANCNNILTPIAKFLSVTGDLPLLVIGWTGFVLFWVLKDKKIGMHMCGSVIIGAILTTIILKNIVYRTRPYIADETYKIWWQAFNIKAYWDTSFPSGHACAAMAGVTAFFMRSKNKKVAWLAYLYPLILGLSRIYLCVHYPSDVIGGYIVGAMAAIICIPFVNLFYYFFNKYPDVPFSRYCLTGSFKKEEK